MSLRAIGRTWLRRLLRRSMAGVTRPPPGRLCRKRASPREVRCRHHGGWTAARLASAPVTGGERSSRRR
eukprot:4602720-Pyramimonas_sp.AAC.1